MWIFNESGRKVAFKQQQQKLMIIIGVFFPYILWAELQTTDHSGNLQ